MGYLVISDIRGCLRELDIALKERRPDDILVILGNSIDGKNSLGVLKRLMRLKEDDPNGVHILRGRHEQFLLNFLDIPIISYHQYVKTGGYDTLIELLPKKPKYPWLILPHVYRHYFKRGYRPLYEFLKSLPFTYETKHMLFTPSGFDPKQKRWEATPKYAFLYSKNHHKHPNKTGKLNIFGTAPTQLIRGDKKNDIWLSPQGSYLAINGNLPQGQLNMVRLTENGVLLDTYIVKGTRLKHRKGVSTT